MALLSGAFLLSAVPCAAPAQTRPSYEDLHSFKNGKPFTIDPFLWAYTADFAKTFAMPQQWVEPGLKNVLAVAWRMTDIGNVTCGHDGNAARCRTPLTCQLDIYYDARLPLPWNHPEINADNIWDGILSTSHLPDPKNSWGTRRFPRGVMSSGGELLYGAKRAPADIVYFDRDFAPGVGLIGYTGPGVCPRPGVPGPATMRFSQPEGAEKERAGRKSPPPVVMEFPERYLTRLSDAYLAGSRSNLDLTERTLHRIVDWTGRSYQDVHAFHGEPFVRDPFIWAYSAEFARKHRMPEQWIEPELKGAQAVAWRMTTVAPLRCGLAGRQDKCWPQLDCQMDLYFATKANLPWNYPAILRDDLLWGVSSHNHLGGIAVQSRFEKYSGSGGGRPKPVMYSGGTLKYGRFSGEIGFLQYYDRKLDGETVLISYRGTCPSTRSKGPAVMAYLSIPDFERSQEQRTTAENAAIVHAVELPESFLVRMKAVFSTGKAPVDAFVDRLIDDFSAKRMSR